MLPAEVTSAAAALGIGLLTGIERERRSREQSHAPAGLRTFAATALAGWGAFTLGGTLLLAALALGLAVLLATAYYRRQGGDTGLTTEVALLLVLLLGAYCTRDTLIAGGLAVALTILLTFREDLHTLVRVKLSETEVRDGLILAGSALIVLPLVPDRFIGPHEAVNLRTVWMLCVLMMGIGALGHFAIRLAGARFGLPLAGFVSGFASSTATVASMGERVRREPSSMKGAVAAATMSSATTMLLMVVVLAAIDWRIAQLLWLHLLLGFLAACAYALRFSLADGHKAGDDVINGHIFDWRLTLGAALVIALVQLASGLLFHWLGNPGVLLSTTISGFADVHAAAASAAVLVSGGKLPAEAVVLPVLAAISTNSVSKCVMALAMGGLPYALRVVPGILLILVALWLPWLVG